MPAHRRNRTGETGLKGSPLVRNQLEGMTKSIALLEYVENRVRPSLAARRIRNAATFREVR
jgi:hypothetical protein